MALDRLWKLYASETDAAADTNGNTVWLQFAPRSSLVALPSTILGDRQPEQSVTVRMRWRDDVTLGSALTGEGRTWFVQQTLEVDRRRWLDVVVTSYYDAPASATWPPVSDGGAPQTGYTLGYRNLIYASSTRSGLTGRVMGWIGVNCTNPDDRVGVIPQRLILGGRNRSGGNFWIDARVYDGEVLGSVPKADGFRVAATDETFPASAQNVHWDWGVYQDQSPSLSVGQQLYVLTSTEVTALPQGSI